MKRREEQRPAPVAATPKQAGEALPEKWNWVELSVWTVRMLTALENGVKGNVWFSLKDKVESLSNLRSAFYGVWRNGGKAGVDGQSVGEFEKDLERGWEMLRQELWDGSYEPRPVRRVYIAKAGSTEKRPLGIPAVRDRVVQGALRHVLEPIFEREFAEHSYGFRPGRSCLDALRRVEGLLKAGCTWVVDADLKSYFDTIPHEQLLELVKQRVADGAVLRLIESYLKAGVMETMKEWEPTTSGTPQGAVISPLLANLYLNPLDHEMAGKGMEMVRYADDLVILSRSEAEAEKALAELERWSKTAGLTLHPEKTRIVDARQKGGFDFLGYHFERGMKWPRKKSIQKLREKVRGITPRSSGECLGKIIGRLNPVLRGWFAYFRYSKATAFESVDGWVRRRLRSLLRKRIKRRGISSGGDTTRWPNKYFEQRSLYSLAQAGALFRQSQA